jgi:hypothetical protein
MPVQPKPGDEAAPPAIDLSEDVFAEETPPADAAEDAAADAPAPAAEVEEPPAE